MNRKDVSTHTGSRSDDGIVTANVDVSFVDLDSDADAICVDLGCDIRNHGD